MKTPKKVWKDIAGKLRNKKGTTTAKVTDMETPADVEEVKVEIKRQTNTVNKATETDTQLCEDINKSSEDINARQPIFESSEKAQNDSTTVEPTSVDREASPSSAEPCFDSDDAEEKPSTRQRQAIVAGIVGAVLLASGVALCIMKMPVVAAVVGIVGLACIGLTLYSTLNPNTKLKKVEDIEVCRRDAKDVCIEQASAKATQ